MGDILQFLISPIKWLGVKFALHHYVRVSVVRRDPPDASIPAWHPTTKWFLRIENRAGFVDLVDCTFRLLAVNGIEHGEKISVNGEVKFTIPFGGYEDIEVARMIVKPADGSIAGISMKKDGDPVWDVARNYYFVLKDATAISIGRSIHGIVELRVGTPPCLLKYHLRVEVKDSDLNVLIGKKVS